MQIIFTTALSILTAIQLVCIYIIHGNLQTASKRNIVYYVLLFILFFESNTGPIEIIKYSWATVLFIEGSILAMMCTSYDYHTSLCCPAKKINATSRDKIVYIFCYSVHLLCIIMIVVEIAIGIGIAIQLEKFKHHTNVLFYSTYLTSNGMLIVTESYKKYNSVYREKRLNAEILKLEEFEKFELFKDNSIFSIILSIIEWTLCIYIETYCNTKSSVFTFGSATLYLLKFIQIILICISLKNFKQMTRTQKPKNKEENEESIELEMVKSNTENVGNVQQMIRTQEPKKKEENEESLIEIKILNSNTEIAIELD